MIKSAVTISLVPEARGGPFIFWDDLAGGCRKAAELGFDAVELFLPAADAVDADSLRSILDRHRLKLAAVGTGAGWLKHKLSLNAEDEVGRGEAHRFVRSLIDLAGPFGAPAIVGSMQGRWGGNSDEAMTRMRLTMAFDFLGDHARQYGVPVLYEPLNRYETNISNTLADGVELLEDVRYCNVLLLADLFHMNIEEADIADSIRAAAKWIGHVHFADSNRRPAGGGHTDFGPVARALRDINYDGYVSAEAFPWPSPDEAAAQTIREFRRHFGSS